MTERLLVRWRCPFSNWSIDILPLFWSGVRREGRVVGGWRGSVQTWVCLGMVGGLHGGWRVGRSGRRGGRVGDVGRGKGGVAWWREGGGRRLEG